MNDHEFQVRWGRGRGGAGLQSLTVLRTVLLAREGKPGQVRAGQAGGFGSWDPLRKRLSGFALTVTCALWHTSAQPQNTSTYWVWCL